MKREAFIHESLIIGGTPTTAMGACTVTLSLRLRYISNIIYLIKVS